MTITERIPATIKGKLYFDDYPSAVLGGDTTIRGYLVRSADFDQLLQKADRIEGVAVGLYKREEVCATTDSGATVRAYVYSRPWCDKSLPIESGDWLKRDKKEIARSQVLRHHPDVEVKAIDQLLDRFNCDWRVASSMLKWSKVA